VGLAIVCLAVAVAAPFLGHPAAAGGAAIPLDAVHVLAAGGWAGTIMIIGVAALPVTLRAQLDDRVLMIKSLLGAFTPIALSCATLLMITGTGEALLQLGQVSALWQTPYGLALVRKLVLVMGVLLLGAWHWRVAQGTMARARSITLVDAARRRGSRRRHRAYGNTDRHTVAHGVTVPDLTVLHRNHHERLSLFSSRGGGIVRPDACGFACATRSAPRQRLGGGCGRCREIP
jgi:hypothetical protein